MGLFVNSFEIELPTIEADLYSIDPQPSGDKYSVLNSHTEDLEDTVGGKGRWYRRGDEYFIAIIGPDRQEYETFHSTGAELSFDETAELDPTTEAGFGVIERALTKGLQWYLETYHGYWYDSVRNAFYQEEILDTVDEYDLHSGIDVRFGHHDHPLFTLDPRIGLIGKQTLTEYLSEWGLDRTQAEFIGEGFMQDGPERRSCTLDGIYSDITVADPSPDPWDDSVLEFIKEEYGQQWAEKVDPTEPLAKIRYNRRDKWYPAAPSLLYPSPGDDRPDSVSERAAKAPVDRWDDVETFLDVIGHIQMGNVEAPVTQSPIRDGTGTYDYPVLTFGQNPSREMELYQPNISLDHSPDLKPRFWNPAKEGHLETVGPRESFDNEIRVAVFHADGDESEALEVYEDIREHAKRLTGINLSERVGRINFEDERLLDEFQEESRANVDAGVAYLPEYDEDIYHRLIDILDDRPLQSLTATKLHSKRQEGNEEDVLGNTAIGLGVKLGVVPFTIEDQLGADAYLGMSVTGYETKVASAVLISGKNGRIVYQSQDPRPSGRSTVTNKGIMQEFLREAVRRANDSPHIPGDALDSLVVHRNGFLGKEEIEGLHEGVERLQDYDYVTDSFEWTGVNVMGDTPHRIFDDDADDLMPEMGAYATLDNETVTVVTTDVHWLDEGSPKPLYCEVAATNTGVDIHEVGRDVFYLSELNWAAPSKGIKNPLTVYLTRRMNSRLNHDRISKLTYPPF
jgi:hypothetical protein